MAISLSLSRGQEGGEGGLASPVVPRKGLQEKALSFCPLVACMMSQPGPTVTLKLSYLPTSPRVTGGLSQCTRAESPVTLPGD